MSDEYLTKTATPPGRHRHAGWLGLILVAATLIAYLPAWHAGFIWDDNDYVTENPLLTASDGLRRIWFSFDAPSQYFPLTYTGFYIERALWGLNPSGYHRVNILLHAANALLLWRLLARLRLPGAWLAAAIFALHPVQVESVAWITERKNVLMGFFFLLSLRAWTEFIAERTKRPRRFYALALVFFALALFAKTTACTLPAALLLILWLKKLPITRRRLSQVAPFVVMGVIMGLVSVWWEWLHQGLQRQPFAIGPVARVLIACRGLWFYAGKLLWPSHLIFSYPRWTISASDPRAYGWVLATVALGGVIWLARPKLGRSAETAALFFAATLSPVLGFIMLFTFVYSFVADHYQYLACIGPMALAAAGMRTGLGRVAAGKPLLQPVLCAALLAALGTLTWRQCATYADSETLWRTTLARNPGSWLAHLNLGTVLFDKGDREGAMVEYHKALAIDPNVAMAHYNLGVALGEKGRRDESIAEYRRALSINLEAAPAHVNLGIALLAAGQADDAIAHFQKALQLKPGLAAAHYNLGLAFLHTGKMAEAIDALKMASRLKPDDLPAQKKLADALIRTGQAAEAIPYCEAVVAAEPEDAHARFALGTACLAGKRPEQALINYKEAARLAPDTPQCLNALAWIYATCPQAGLRNGAEAMRLAARACAITQRRDATLLDTLAAACAEAGRFDDAIKTTGEISVLAAAAHDTNMADTARQRLLLYQAGKPYRDEP